MDSMSLVTRVRATAIVFRLTTRRFLHRVAFSLAVCGLAASGTALASSAGHSTSKLKVVATGLNNPRKVVVGRDGAVYVVEAGTGGATVRGVPGRNCHATCIGLSGSITRVRNGSRARVVTGLLSAAGPIQDEAQGPADVVVEGNTYYVLQQSMSMSAKGATGSPATATAGDLISTPAGKAAPKVIADFDAFEASHNPDHGAGPGAKFAQPPIDSDPFAVVSYQGGFAVADAAANDLLWVSPKGRISVLAVFPTQIERLTKSEQRQLGANPAPRSLPIQSVPSSVTVGPDGALYVGELTGWPYKVGRARVWRVVPGAKPSIYAGGFTNISDIAFEGDDLLVLEIAAKGLLDPSSPGALIRVSPGGARTVVVSTGLFEPTGLAVGNGSIYMSNNSIFPGAGAPPHGELVSIPALSGS